MAKLIINKTNGDAVVYPLIESELLIGRLDSADLVVEDPAVSRVHAKIVQDGEVCILVDLESTIGTQVNGEEVDRHYLNSGDVIEIGSFKIEYRE